MTPKKPNKRHLAARTVMVATIALMAVPALAVTGRAHLTHDLGVAARGLPLSDLIELKARIENGGHLPPDRHLQILREARGV